VGRILVLIINGGVLVLRRTGLVSVIMLILLGAALITGCGQEKTVEKETEITVNAAAAQKQDISKSATYSGIVRGQNEVYIIAKAAARVTGIYANPGDQVSQGQTLITLDSSDFDAAVRQAQAGLQMAELSLENARQNFERIEKLYEADAISQKDFDAAQNGVKTAEVAVEQASAGMAQVMTQVNNCTITSPINGILGSINLSLGDMASPASPAAVVTDTSRLEIEVLVSESEVSYITPGSEVEVRVKAVGDQKFKGAIANVATVADPMKRNYAVKVSLDNPDNVIKSGMFAEVIASTINKDDAVCVPQSAIVPKGATTVVYVVDKDNRAREKQVTVGIENTTIVELTDGIQPGEKVITKGNTLVNEGTLVRVVAGGGK
jgi:RND family efflux transporter MFP subunit